MVELTSIVRTNVRKPMVVLFVPMDDVEDLFDDIVEKVDELID